MDINRIDPDPLETQEWRDALGSVLEFEGPERAHFLLENLIDKARREGAPGIGVLGGLESAEERRRNLRSRKK